MLKFALAQINPIVGDLDFNANKIVDFSKRAASQLADVVVFPELAICGYPPEDLLLTEHFITKCEQTLILLLAKLPPDIVVVLGSVRQINNNIYNVAIAILNGKIIGEYAKQCLPNYGVFDEARYFTAGTASVIITIKQQRCALTICEDLWSKPIAMRAKKLGVDYILNLNASPYQINKQQLRIQTMQQNCAGVPLIYVNQVGGQDELVFDGGSFVLNANGNKVFTLTQFKEQLQIYSPAIDAPAISNQLNTKDDKLAEIYQALVLGTKDYVVKNNFTKIVLGLSGGIDSALTLCIAVDALGANKVEVIMLPSRYNLDISLTDAKLQAQQLKVKYQVISIEPIFKSCLASLDFLATSAGVEQENIQARIRGMILMARSNQTGAMLLTTGNKSETSVGYATLYGDMAGGFAPLNDIYKTTVYQLAKWLDTTQSSIIPQRVISRAPSAELSANQYDTDSLPDYDLLDKILTQHIEHNKSRTQIKALGFDAKWVDKIINLVRINEYKRRQAPLGVKISGRSYGKDWRYPITNKYLF